MSMTGFSGSDDVLACFAAGNAFSWDDWFRKETEEAHFQDVIDMMLNLSIFVYIGAVIPWNEFHDPVLGLTWWRLVIIAILILIFRRLPIVLLLKPVMPAMKTYREALFSGWFGPMGVGALFLSKIAKEQLEQVYPKVEGQEDAVPIRLINPIVLFIVLSSVLVHGTTIPLFQLGKRIRSRTLSFASTSSNPMIMKLPKFSARRHRSSPESTMTETQRNTLYNTAYRQQQLQQQQQRQQQEAGGDSATSGETMISSHNNYMDYAINMPSSNASDIPEEEFLPSDEPTSLHPMESSNIRFVEPVKPRTSTGATSEMQGMGADLGSEQLQQSSSSPADSRRSSQHKRHMFRGRSKKPIHDEEASMQLRQPDTSSSASTASASSSSTTNAHPH
ncbi:hypothetical protein LRAMOSA00971 [Lichtheimia ramosa]|uniref:Cation/H+ exchanger transmembrane domain-containing protein n=1 Tax=Lichtheimia ramosa TaxID=688394 RepID=A0A077WAI0_9FUNG|nr:hypothetical protein LRAMOSA00971 [Lichtheimia ramosa]